MSPEALVQGLVWSHPFNSLLALALGFGVAGLLASGYQVMTERPATFRLLEHGERRQALAAVPFLMFAAPFIIVRATVRAGRIGAGSFALATLAAVVAGFWSLMSGTVVVMTLQACGRLVA